MEQLKPALPDFALRVSAGPDNILNSLLKSRKIAFDALNAEGANCDSLPVSIRLRTEGLAYGNVVLDTVTGRHPPERETAGIRPRAGERPREPRQHRPGRTVRPPRAEHRAGEPLPAQPRRPAKDSASGWT